MKKRKHTLIIVSVILALLLGILFLLTSMPASPKNETSTDDSQTFENIIDMSDKKISTIAIQNTSGSYEIISKENEEKQIYVLSEEDENKTVQSTTETLIESLMNLKPVQIIEENSEDLSVYGLDNSQAELTVTFDNDDKIVLKLGNNAPLSKGAYMRVNDESKVYLISETDKEIFLNEKSFYLEKE